MSTNYPVIPGGGNDANAYQKDENLIPAQSGIFDMGSKSIPFNVLSALSGCFVNGIQVGTNTAHLDSNTLTINGTRIYPSGTELIVESPSGIKTTIVTDGVVKSQVVGSGVSIDEINGTLVFSLPSGSISNIESAGSGTSLISQIFDSTAQLNSLIGGSGVSLEVSNGTITINSQDALLPFVGSSVITNGEQGLVPAPGSGQQDYTLHGDGTWRQSFLTSSGVIGADSLRTSVSTALPAANTNFQLGTIQFQEGLGNITQNADTITLKSGKTYILTADLQGSWTAVTGGIGFQWFNVTAASTIGNRAFARPTVHSATIIQNSSVANAIIKPLVDTEVGVRIEAGAVGLSSMRTDTSYISVIQITDEAAVGAMVGASATSDGFGGLMPAPGSGQESYVFKGSGTWEPNLVGELFVGASASGNGVAGLVPAPASGQESYVLRGSGTWEPIVEPVDFIGAIDGVSLGVNGLVPAPASGQDAYILKGSGVWTQEVKPSGLNIGLGEHTFDQTVGDDLRFNTIMGLSGVKAELIANSGIILTSSLLPFVGSSATTDGVNGLVPPPASGQESYILKGSGTWEPGLTSEPLSNGISTLASNHDITTPNITTFQDIALSVTVPSAGRWRLEANVTGRFVGTDDDGSIAAIITDSSNVTVNDGGPIFIANISEVGSVGQFNVTGTSTLIGYVSTGGPATYKIRVSQGSDAQLQEISAGSSLRYEQVPEKSATIPSETQVTEWTDYPVSIVGSVSNPTKGTVTIDRGQYKVVGKTLHIRYDYEQSAPGLAGNGNYRFSLPAGFTIDLPVSMSNLASAQILGGSAMTFDGTTFGYGTARMPNDSSVRDSFEIVVGNPNSFVGVGNTFFSLSSATPLGISAQFSVPIL